jgi:hypothetical protein
MYSTIPSLYHNVLLLENRRKLAFRPGEGGRALASGGKGLSRCGVSGPDTEPTGCVLCLLLGRLRMVRKEAAVDVRTGVTAALATVADGNRLGRVVSRRMPALSWTNRSSSACCFVSIACRSRSCYSTKQYQLRTAKQTAAKTNNGQQGLRICSV